MASTSARFVLFSSLLAILSELSHIRAIAEGLREEHSLEQRLEVLGTDEVDLDLLRVAVHTVSSRVDGGHLLGTAFFPEVRGLASATARIDVTL